MKKNLIKLLVEEKALIRLLKTIGYKEYPTRELLKKLGAYGYGHRVLVKAAKNGFVDRRVSQNKIYNKLTKKGKELIKLAKEVGV